MVDQSIRKDGSRLCSVGDTEMTMVTEEFALFICVSLLLSSHRLSSLCYTAKLVVSLAPPLMPEARFLASYTVKTNDELFRYRCVFVTIATVWDEVNIKLEM
jgi:hypothetical protein